LGGHGGKGIPKKVGVFKRDTERDIQRNAQTPPPPPLKERSVKTKPPIKTPTQLRGFFKERSEKRGRADKEKRLRCRHTEKFGRSPTPPKRKDDKKPTKIRKNREMGTQWASNTPPPKRKEEEKNINVSREKVEEVLCPLSPIVGEFLGEVHHILYKHCRL